MSNALPELALAERFFVDYHDRCTQACPGSAHSLCFAIAHTPPLSPPDNLSWLLLDPKAMLLCGKFAGSDLSLIQRKHILDLSAQIDVLLGEFWRVVREQAQNILRHQHLAVTLGILYQLKHNEIEKPHRTKHHNARDNRPP